MLLVFVMINGGLDYDIRVCESEIFSELGEVKKCLVINFILKF